MSEWLYRIRGYAPTNQGGELLLETVHASEASRDIEIAAWRARIRRGEVSHIEVVDLQKPFDGVTKIYR